MKKSILQFSVIAAIAATMTLSTSCSSDDDAFVPEPIQFSVGFKDMATTRATVETGKNWTSVTVGNTWEANDLVSIRTTKADGTTYAVFDYKVAAGSGAQTLTPNSTDADKQFYWKQKNENKTVEAWSYGTTASAGTTQPNLQDFEVLSDQDAASSYNKELLYAHDQTITQGTTNNITLYHQMALVTIDIISAEDKVTAITLGSTTNKIPLNGKFTAPTSTANYGTWGTATSETTGTIKPRYISKSDYSATDPDHPQKTTYEAVVIPKNYENQEDLFYITYDGTTYAYKGVAADVINAGKHYTYTVTITTQGITSTATIQNWESETGRTATAELQ